MEVDRTLQREILERLREAYPSQVRTKALVPVDEDPLRDKQFAGTIMYLEEHGLLKGGVIVSTNGQFAWSASKITAAGLDFLEDDGGLTAILGTVTVKLHADTIRELMLAKVDAAPLPPTEKSALKKAISTLSGEALKEIAKKLVAAGMDSAPDAIAFLKGLLH
ncbi:DUF2513 domain-containing protein [Variovorax sp. ZS18.2.2]|uniref:DUF2513 domain-containing protein n=1 Tax=Variovorax sp. ZS18.2.2 TaxID=2971255 RepID=UPI0021515FEC|nr:DUF2513 domain-containing protein [Variovorax sp. ZS18.2.2]MCR6480567.1 DUF2513 domain-containing protein [Variovorax sp. ZS18.2.2]